MSYPGGASLPAALPASASLRMRRVEDLSRRSTHVDWGSRIALHTVLLLQFSERLCTPDNCTLFVQQDWVIHAERRRCHDRP